MSTCSTATGAARDGRRRHGSCEDAFRGGGGGLEMRWRELEREWDAYKTSRCSGASRRRHHRRSRSGSGTGTPSSAVIVAAEPADAPGSHLLLGVRLGGSPRRLVSSLQRDGSSSSTASAGVTPERGRYDGDDHHDAASSVSSVDAGAMAAMAAAASSNSSCSSAATSLFSLRDDELAVVGEAAKTGGTATPATGSIGRFVAAIAAAGVVLLVAAIMAAAVLEFAMDDGQAEFLVPT
ncbi:hypothetical protein DAI22_04g104900 [Oryza sativa Japonica Group]|jgi:hypothetical protein|uniref:OSJNBa0044M19.11 protein n=3 Tax=Oryza TaxID=4527 RepID=Q7XLP5_ORYSJ|nr:hypothetical protein DAI22_04g104900 [Oryza sativa Japonica Group]CAE05024.2 OSJNBa0044M19.11 [Oryza sativa Japonica Group]CAH66573.1 OSIGBa0148P16.7 [Oryza sativa]